MCLYPTLRLNRKYLPNKKNNGNPPQVPDERVRWVPTGCQRCMECRKQKGMQWSIRLQEEIRTDRTGKFVTLTFSTESLKELTEHIYNNMGNITGYDLDNEIATLAVRRFLERWRKKYKVSVKHWLITELGQGKHAQWNTTEHLHLHGIIFTDKKDEIKEIWKYGYVFIGDYVTEKTINYMAKYMTKVDPIHTEYTPKILTSAGIGRNYTMRHDSKLNAYKNKDTDETYTTRDGRKLNLPIYFRNKIYTEQQRESLWLEKLDKQIRWVDKQKVSIANGEETYFKLLKQAQDKNRRLGFPSNEKDWDRLNYELIRREHLHRKRLDKVPKNTILQS